MTLTAEPEAPSAEPPAPARPRLGRRGRIAVVAGAAVVLGGGVGLAAWQGTASAALDRVEVIVDAQPFHCAQASDAYTTHIALNNDSGVVVALPAVRLHPGLSCTMSVAVSNGSDAEVRIERVVLPFMGPDAGAGVHATRIRQQGVQPSAEGGPDAVFDYAHNPSGDSSAGAHGAARLTADLTWSNGCMSAGSSEWHRRAPIVTVSVNGVTRDLHGQGAGYAVVGTATSCDR